MKIKNLVRPRKRVAQEPPVEAPAEQPAPTEKPPDPNALLQAALAENAELLAHSFVLGVALVLVKGGLATKQDLTKLKPTSIMNSLAQLTKSIVQERQIINQELRLLWRLGAAQYIARKSRQLKDLG